MFEIEGTRELFIAELRKLMPDISLLITSRHTMEFERIFNKCTRLEISTRDEDVRSYLETRIKDQPQLARYIEADPTLYEVVLSTIIDKTKGMYVCLLFVSFDGAVRESENTCSLLPVSL